MIFDNRWMIIGRLITSSPLHIGNGGITDDRKSLVSKKRDPAGNIVEEQIEVTAIGTDRNGRPYIPGSSLKGNLRALASMWLLSTAEELFGSEDPEIKTSVGGKAEFYDARAIQDSPSFTHSPPHWEATRMTGVTASVTLDRMTKTASEERLFHQEFVPPGVSFEVVISGQNFSEAELTDLLWLLNGFNSGTAKLGAGTGNGGGLMHWELTDLKQMTKAGVADWLAKGAKTTGYAALDSISASERQRLVAKASSLRPTTTQLDTLTINVRLDFQSNFLVNDPSRTGKLDEGKAGHEPLLNADGKLLLPASSMRGAFRSQAEKIIRTIGNEQSACYLNDRGMRKPCTAIDGSKELDQELKRLCPICQLFGAAGWRAPIRFSDFTSTDAVLEDELFQQEFVAIDRFTGGGAEQKKFNARSVYRPSLSGTISLELSRASKFAADGWPLGLLTLVLRDLIEGDVRLGLGAAKGYGAARLTIQSINLPIWDICPDVLKKSFSSQQWQSLSAASAPDTHTQSILKQWVTELATHVQRAGANQ